MNFVIMDGKYFFIIVLLMVPVFDAQNVNGKSFFMYYKFFKFYLVKYDMC